MRTTAITLAVLALAALTGPLARADDPPRPPTPFPYTELAQLARLAAAPPAPMLRIPDDAEPVALRRRPAPDWPVVRLLQPGETARAVVATPGPDPWLRVRLPSGAEGWLRAADADPPSGLLKRLPKRNADPILLSTNYGLTIYPRPDAPPVAFRLYGDAQYPVLGRSHDLLWIALLVESLEPPVVWVQADRLRLTDPQLTVRDLPVFIAARSATVVLRHNQTNAAQAILPPSTSWRWTPDHQLLVGDDDAVIRYWPFRDELTREPAPHAGGLLSPDGRYAAFTTCPGEWRLCAVGGGRGDDVRMLNLETGVETITPRVHQVPATDAPGPRTMHWSPDSSRLLVEFHPYGASEPGPRQTLIRSDGWSKALPNFQDEPYFAWFRWLPNSMLWTRNESDLFIFNGDGDLIHRLQPNERAWWIASVHPADSTLWVRTTRGWLEIDPVTGTTTPIPGSDDWGSTTRVHWTPDGERALIGIVHQRAYLFHRADQRIVPIDGLPPPPADLPDYQRNRWFSSVHWSPDGDRFLINLPQIGVHLVQLSDGGAASVRHLPALAGDHGRETHVERLRWSPNGRSFALHRQRLYTPSEPLNRLNPNSLVARDGLAVPFWLRRCWGANHHRLSRFELYDRDGNLIRSIRSDAAADLRWSANGRWLVIADTPGAGCA